MKCNHCGHEFRKTRKQARYRHQVICGDCTDQVVVDRLIQARHVHMSFTSPPYNLGRSAHLRQNDEIGDNVYGEGYNDNREPGEWKDLIERSLQIALDRSDYVFMNIQLLAGNKIPLLEILYDFREKLADISVWDKGYAAPMYARRVMNSRFEFVLIFSQTATRAVGTRDFRGDVSNVYTGAPQQDNKFYDLHAATFPIDFPLFFIGTFSNSGETIFDPFLGTGTTLLAANQLERNCLGCEIVPAFIAITLERWHKMTGEKPVLIEGKDEV